MFCKRSVLSYSPECERSSHGELKDVVMAEYSSIPESGPVSYSPKESVNPQRQQAESALRGIAGVEGVGEGRDDVGAPTWIAYVRDHSVVSRLPTQVAERVVVPHVTGEITARDA
jgi:hypothetical protein